MTDDLEPLSPEDAMEMWLDRQRSERSDETIQSYQYRIKQFVDWCQTETIDNLNDLTGRDLYQFDSARRANDLTRSTLNNQMGTLQKFLVFCADIEAVSPELPVKIDVPKLSKTERTNDEKLSAERADTVRENLARYYPASRDHVLFALAWHTGARLGGLRSLDIQDCYLETSDLERLRHQDDIDEETVEGIEVPFLYFQHRPESDTKLKKKEGERPVSISPEIGELPQEYLQTKRDRVKDEYRREPLLSTKKGSGRMSKGAIRSRCHIVTQPCYFGIKCPHGRDEETCEALESGYENRCPSSRSPHPIRTGAITHHIDVGWPIEKLAERVNATPQVIRDHYDQPNPFQRMKSRRDHLNKLDEGGS
jgi:site-specific recombinase XerD